MEQERVDYQPCCLDHPNAALLGGTCQRSAAEVVRLVDVHSVPQQQVDHPLAASAGGGYQRGPAFAVLKADIANSNDVGRVPVWGYSSMPGAGFD